MCEASIQDNCIVTSRDFSENSRISNLLLRQPTYIEPAVQFYGKKSFDPTRSLITRKSFEESQQRVRGVLKKSSFKKALSQKFDTANSSFEEAKKFYSTQSYDLQKALYDQQESLEDFGDYVDDIDDATTRAKSMQSQDSGSNTSGISQPHQLIRCATLSSVNSYSALRRQISNNSNGTASLLHSMSRGDFGGSGSGDLGCSSWDMVTIPAEWVSDVKPMCDDYVSPHIRNKHPREDGLQIWEVKDWTKGYKYKSVAFDELALVLLLKAFTLRRQERALASWMPEENIGLRDGLLIWVPKGAVKSKGYQFSFILREKEASAFLICLRILEKEYWKSQDSIEWTTKPSWRGRLKGWLNCNAKRKPPRFFIRTPVYGIDLTTERMRRKLNEQTSSLIACSDIKLEDLRRVNPSNKRYLLVESYRSFGVN